MTDFMKAMKQYGADVDGAMERFLADEVLYKDCLKMFARDEGFETLGTAITEKNYKDAFDAAHTLKGVSANLGLLPLYGKLCAMVEPLRACDYTNMDLLYQEIMQARANFVAVLG